MKVKICGLTRIEDVVSCENLGVHSIGFINIKRSKRFLKIDEINNIIDSAQLNSQVNTVAVLEPKDCHELEIKIKKLKVDNIQLHSLSADEIKQFKEKNKDYYIIRAVGLSDKLYYNKKRQIMDFAKICDGILLDYELSGRTGGTGFQIPINIAVDASKIARQSNKDIEIFIAGGIDSERVKNEGYIINKYFDYWDVNSGVEEKPGIKNHSKITEIMRYIEK